jgi:hypothetical protein
MIDIPGCIERTNFKKYDFMPKIMIISAYFPKARKRGSYIGHFWHLPEK